MNQKLLLLLVIFVGLCFQQVNAQVVDDEDNLLKNHNFENDFDHWTISGDTAVYLDDTKSADVRAEDIVSRLTLEEKVMQLGNSAPAIERLHINAYEWANEALHGIAWSGTATVFPQAIAMSSTWEPELIRQVGTAISDEARVKNNLNGKGLTYWSPTVNMSRDPRWGRIEESYGEDPHLASRIAVNFIKGMQGDHPDYLKTVASPKHYIANNTEFNRGSSSSDVGMRDLLEYYMPVFKNSIIEGEAHSIMSAYNAVNGVPASANKFLLQDILRDRWGFGGYVVTDCGAVNLMRVGHNYVDKPEEAAAEALKAGADLACGSSDVNVMQQYASDAVKQGLLTEQVIDTAVKRLFRARILLGEFDPPEEVPYTQIPSSKLNSHEHKELALETARKSIVLLKNENEMLPLDQTETESIAVIGPNADEAKFGGYSGTPPESYSPLRGISDRMDVPYETFGVQLQASDFDEQEGVQLETSTESGMNLGYINDGDYVVYEDVTLKEKTSFDARVATQTGGGQIEVRLDSLDGSRIAVVDVPFTGEWQNWETVTEPIAKLSGTYDVYLVFKGSDGFLFNLNWVRFNPEETMNTGEVSYAEGTTITGEKNQDEFDRAVHLAENSEVAIVVVGTDESVVSEGNDRDDMNLAGAQKELIQAVYDVNPNTIVVLSTGAPLSINWTDEHVPAIFSAWYGGQSQGIAIADVIFGDYNPGGKLSSTWYKTVDDLPEFTDYRIRETGRTYLYFEDEVLYPFGYGLSYTDFTYSNINVSSTNISKNGSITVTVDIQNTGGRKGDEVAQLYIRDVASSVKRPLKQLVGFERITLAPGETGTVTFDLSYDELAFYEEETSNFIVEGGEFELRVGSSSKEILLDARINAEQGLASDMYQGVK